MISPRAWSEPKWKMIKHEMKSPIVRIDASGRARIFRLY
jgi:hypothetical protein